MSALTTELRQMADGQGYNQRARMLEAANELERLAIQADARLQEIERLNEKVREVERQRTEAREQRSALAESHRLQGIYADQSAALLEKVRDSMVYILNTNNPLVADSLSSKGMNLAVELNEEIKALLAKRERPQLGHEKIAPDGELHIINCTFNGESPPARDAPDVLTTLDALYLQTADYITRNNLGPVHHNQVMKDARDVLAAAGYQVWADKENAVNCSETKEKS